MSDRAREERENIARGVKHARPYVPVIPGSNFENASRQRAALRAREGKPYRCEYCGGPSDLPQVCARCGEGD